MRLRSVVVFLRDVRETTNRGVTLDEYFQPKTSLRSDYSIIQIWNMYCLALFKGQRGLVAIES